MESPESNLSRIEAQIIRRVELIRKDSKPKTSLRISCKKCPEGRNFFINQINLFKAELHKLLEDYPDDSYTLRLGDKQWNFPENEQGVNFDKVEPTPINTNNDMGSILPSPASKPPVELSNSKSDSNQTIERAIKETTGTYTGPQRKDEEVTPLRLEEVKTHFVQRLYLKDHWLIDILMGAVVANLFDGPDSLNLDIIGPPSSAKTELLRSLSLYSPVYTISTLTPQTLISGIKPGESSLEGSLLLTLNKAGKRILVVKDLTTILEMRSEARQEILSQLREIADGYLSKAFGTGKEVRWKGKLGIIAAVTNVIDEHHGHNQILGERFLYCRISNDNPQRMAESARRMTGREIAMRQQLQETVKQFLDQFREPKLGDVYISEGIEKKLVALSCFVAKGRTGVSRDRYHQTVEYLPEAEGPARLIKQLWILGAGVSIVQAKVEFDEGVYSIIKRIATNSLPRHRHLILKTMWDNLIMSAQWELTKAIGRLIKTPTETTKRYLEDLWMIGLLNRGIEGEEGKEDKWKVKKVPYSWQLSKECIELINESEIYLSNSEDETPFYFE